MAEGFVRINSYWSPEEAHLAKLHLESYGIDVELDGEMMIRTAWLDANAIGGVKLLVKDCDADQAKAILNSKPDVGVLDESSESQGLTELVGDRPGWQQGGVEEGEREEESSAPRPLRRMRSSMKVYIWFILGLNASFFILMFMLLISHHFVISVISTAAIVVTLYLLLRDSSTKTIGGNQVPSGP